MSESLSGTTAGDLLIEKMVFWVFLMDEFGFDEDDVEALFVAHPCYYKGSIYHALHGIYPVPYSIGDINEAFWMAAELSLKRLWRNEIR